ncbi:uncharacterized protein LOC143462490 isoform X2 [Clavelina lepadiformis]|uniref:uncharacterized protein LOC143462490 isoform X2 n=1 Tax=Clavelina lepadiformis TaxID=159417 RepID=UPI00404278E8
MKFVIFLFLLVSITELSDCKKIKCDKKTTFKGCKLRRNGRCFCGTRTACKNPFLYPSRKVCRRKTQKLRHVCVRLKPCGNDGICMSGRKNRYTCVCSGTGYYGKNCETECPTPNRESSQFWKYPPQCVSI